MKNSPLTVKFALDSMLGRLARYLLHTGYDCFYRDHIDDSVLAKRAQSDNRIVLTRDRDFVRDPSLRMEVYVLRAKPLKYHLRHLGSAFRLTFHPTFFFTRCSSCNNPLQEVKKDRVRNLIPDETEEWIDQYFQCENCEKLYWKGSHHEDLIRKLRKWNLLQDDPV